MRLVVGLGNPGGRYAATRHNVAWRVLELLAGRWRAQDDSVPGVYRARRARVGGDCVELLQPLTFMNQAGEALWRWLHEHEGVPDVLIVTDDVHLPVGALRIRARGSSGGHRGLESVEAALGTRDYARLRIGVGTAENGAQLREHVLEEFAPEELPQVEQAVRHAAEAVECWVTDGTRAAMNRFNRRIPKEGHEE